MTHVRVSVVIGRFQVPTLHAGHQYLINYARERGDLLVIVLASSGGMPTRKNPLPFAVRKEMFAQAYPDAKVLHIVDHPISPTFWSTELDELLEKEFPGAAIALYGSRDSFLEVYDGRYPIVTVPQADVGESGTRVREAARLPRTEEGREALIWAVNNRYPIIYTTADIAITHPDRERVLLIGKKRHEGRLSFCGGYLDQKGESHRDVAVRERKEEVLDIETGPFLFIDSAPIDDPRYRGTPDGCTTAFFRTEYTEGEPKPGDDADYVGWVHRAQLLRILVPWHYTLGEKLLANW